MLYTEQASKNKKKLKLKEKTKIKNVHSFSPCALAVNVGIDRKR